jgi:hypothetical protein
MTESPLAKYALQYRKCNYFEEKQESEIQGTKGKSMKPQGKYNFPVKKLDNKHKMPQKEMIERITADYKLFEDFLKSFTSDSEEKFSKYFEGSLGANYINTYLNRFIALLDILKCSQGNLKDSIVYVFRESFTGEEGRALLEALFYIREDYKTITLSAELRKYYLSLYDLEV